MKRTLALVLVAAGWLAGPAQAQGSKEQDIDALLQAVDWDRRIENSFRLMRSGFVQGMRNRAGANPELLKLMEQEFDAYFTLSKFRADLRPKAVAMYSEKFSQDEIRELSKIYNAPLYRKHVAFEKDLSSMVGATAEKTIRDGVGDLVKKVMDRAMAEGLFKPQ
jgi:hypothetical protein